MTLRYSSFCVFQPYKSASTFLEAFFRGHSSESLLAYEKHGSLPCKEAGVKYIITVRDPIDLYLSQYCYGLEGRSGLRNTIEAKTEMDVYGDGLNGFDRWLSYLNSPEICSALPEYSPFFSRDGFATWRFMMLATFEYKLPEPAIDVFLRFERLREDLSNLVSDVLPNSILSVPAALLWIENAPRLNYSRFDLQRSAAMISKKTLSKIIERDRRLFDFYPESKARCIDALQVQIGSEIPVAKLITKTAGT